MARTARGWGQDHEDHLASASLGDKEDRHQEKEAGPRLWANRGRIPFSLSNRPGPEAGGQGSMGPKTT